MEHGGLLSLPCSIIYCCCLGILDIGLGIEFSHRMNSMHQRLLVWYGPGKVGSFLAD